jgi:hypothetical protein
MQNVLTRVRWQVEGNILIVLRRLGIWLGHLGRSSRCSAAYAILKSQVEGVTRPRTRACADHGRGLMRRGGQAGAPKELRDGREQSSKAVAKGRRGVNGT